jgi:hypothetical protein
MLRDFTCSGRRYFNCCFVGHNLDHRVILLYGSSNANQPAGDLALLDTLANIRKFEL